MRVFRGRLSNFSLGIEGRKWDATTLIPDHCLSIYFASASLRCFPFYVIIHSLEIISSGFYTIRNSYIPA